jgi:hypothetical protein
MSGAGSRCSVQGFGWRFGGPGAIATRIRTGRLWPRTIWPKSRCQWGRRALRGRALRGRATGARAMGRLARIAFAVRAQEWAETASSPSQRDHLVLIVILRSLTPPERAPSCPPPDRRSRVGDFSTQGSCGGLFPDAAARKRKWSQRRAIRQPESTRGGLPPEHRAAQTILMAGSETAGSRPALKSRRFRASPPHRRSRPLHLSCWRPTERRPPAKGASSIPFQPWRARKSGRRHATPNVPPLSTIPVQRDRWRVSTTAHWPGLEITEEAPGNIRRRLRGRRRARCKSYASTQSLLWF